MAKNLRINKKQRAESALGDKNEADKNKTRLEYLLRGFSAKPAQNKQFCSDILMLSWKDALKHIDVKVLDKLKVKGQLRENSKAIQALKVSEVFSNETFTSQVADFVRGKVSLKNVILAHKVAGCFRQRDLAAKIFSYIQRCFTTVARTPSFAELEITEVKRILSSSELAVTSELEVAAAADAWLKHKYDERKQFSKDLLLTVRLNLLPDSVLENVFQKSNKKGSSAFQKNVECLDLVSEILEDKKKFYKNKNFSSCNTRCCSQKEFNIQIFGRSSFRQWWRFKVKNIVVDSENPNDSKLLSDLPKNTRFYSPVVVKHDIYMIYHTSNEYLGVCKYSSRAESWKKVTVICNGREGFTACAFADKIYIAGGMDKNENGSKSCIELSTTDRKHAYTKKMNEGRIYAAAAVFEERLVVAGGYPRYEYVVVDTASVEAFEHASNTWTSMPPMMNPRSGHQLVAVKNKLFVFSLLTEVFEVYDSRSNKFAILKYPSRFAVDTELNRINGAVQVGGKIIIFRSLSTKVTIFDPDKGKWSEEICEATKDFVTFNCLKLPKM